MKVPATIDLWHTYMRAQDLSLLDALLADNVVFESPVVHTPQRGKAITFKYLSAAAEVLGTPSFHYVNEWYGNQSTVLEFVCEIDGISINGIDMIFWDERDQITRFKVMVRPLKAINLLHQMMGQALMRAAAGHAS